MKKELDEALCRDFPNLYRDRHASMQVTCMCWGFSCSNGWHDIIRNLSAKLEALIVKLPEEDRPYAVQVKEKFGGLRFYMTSESEEMRELINAAEEMSYKTCEVCGKPGESYGDGWIKTLCAMCIEERKAGKRGLNDTNER